MDRRSVNRWCRQAVARHCWLLLVWASCALAGCGGSDQPQLEDYLEELEFESPLQETTEIDLGAYQVSSAARRGDPSDRREPPMWVQIRFSLSIATTPEEESAVLDANERHRGMVDDAILSVCRSASITELEDNRWASIKSRMLDRLRPILGEHRIRQIMLNDFEWEPI